jgi:hypothetical protein
VALARGNRDVSGDRHAAAPRQAPATGFIREADEADEAARVFAQQGSAMDDTQCCPPGGLLRGAIAAARQSEQCWNC